MGAAVSTEGSGGDATRLLVVVLIVGLAAWTGFTLYERFAGVRAAATPEPKKDERLEAFVADGRAAYERGDHEGAEEKLHKASGLDGQDLRVLEGFAAVDAARAEATWWDLTFGRYDQTERLKLLKKLDADVSRARRTVAAAMEKTEDESLRSRLRLSERRLNAMLVVALALHGDEAQAKGALGARLADHPQRKLLSQFVSMVGKPRPETADDPQVDGGVNDQKKPTLAPSDPQSPKISRRRAGHFEFEDEPTTHGLPKQPGELEVTVGKERIRTTVEE